MAKTAAQLVAQIGEENSVKVLLNFAGRADKRAAKKAKNEKDKLAFKAWIKAGRPGSK